MEEIKKEDLEKAMKKMEKNEIKSQWKWWHFLILFILICWLVSLFSDNKNPQKEEVKVETRQEKIEKQFNPWDGSHLALTQYIKDSMNDPKSYEHIKTTYSDMGDHLVIMTEFRGKNAFGGVVRNYVKAKVDLEGNIIKIIEQGY
ncbi:MAG: hypothetical protein ACOYWZ_13295 [Bacillota bacterium]